jgi:phospholipid/cholesterol/gamma-HCH transport system substrate-binding protein
LKITKEVKTGVIAILAIALIITGVNFLKGNSFFGGDDVYYGYFPESGGLLPASGVAVNGVGVGKVIAIEYMPHEPIDRKVRITFNIQNKDIRIPKGTEIQIGSLDLFNKAILLNFPHIPSGGYYHPGAKLQGEVAKDMMQQVQAYADPLTKKLQKLMGNVDRVVTSFSSFWDTTATSEIEASLKEVKFAVKRFSNLSLEMESLVAEERVKLSAIFTNVASITSNLDRSNKEITSILGNTKRFTDDLVTSDFKNVISDAHKVLGTLNKALEETEKGKGNLAKFLKDETFYNDLLLTNKKMQDLIDDLHANPERYIHLSVFGRKVKGVPLKPKDEEKLRKLLDSIPLNK